MTTPNFEERAKELVQGVLDCRESYCGEYSYNREKADQISNQALEQAYREGKERGLEEAAKFVEDGALGYAGRDTRYDVASRIRELITQAGEEK